MDIITTVFQIAYVFVPALLLTMVTKFSELTFLGFVSIFLFAGGIFTILPSYCMALGVILAGTYLYLMLTNKGERGTA